MGDPQAPRTQDVDYGNMQDTRKQWGGNDEPDGFISIDDPYNYPEEYEQMMERNLELAQGENYDINQQNIVPEKLRRLHDRKSPVPYENTDHFYQSAKRLAAHLENNQ